EIQITDAMQTLMSQQSFTGVKYQGRSFDCGGKVGFLLANLVYGLDRPELAEPVLAELRKMNLLLDLSSEPIAVREPEPERMAAEQRIRPAQAPRPLIASAPTPAALPALLALGSPRA